MSLEDFRNKTEKPKKHKLAKKLDSTPCPCGLKKIHTFQKAPDHLDLLAHLRARHDVKFSKARTLAMKMTENEIDLELDDENDEENEDEDFDWDEFYE